MIIDEKRKREFLISSVKISIARKNRSRSNMKLEVDKFARGTK